MKKENGVPDRATKSVSLEPFDHWSGHTDLYEHGSESLEWADCRDGDIISFEVEGNEEPQEVEGNESQGE